MKRIMEIANAVAKALEEYGATVDLAPEYTLKEAKTMRVVVVPVGVTHHLLSRGHRQDDYKVQVGILKKATEDELDELIEFSESTAVSLLERFFDGARCFKAEHAPPVRPGPPQGAQAVHLGDRAYAHGDRAVMTVEISFDEATLTARVAKVSLAILKRMGAYVRKVAQSKVKTSPNASPPGSPPHSRKGLLRRAILFGAEPDRKRVLIGPGFRFVGTSALAHEFGNAPKKAPRICGTFEGKPRRA